MHNCKMKKTFIFSLILLLLFSSLSFAHPGRLDSNGGHWDRKSGTYHYHRYNNENTNTDENSYNYQFNIDIDNDYNYRKNTIPSYIVEEYDAKEVELSKLEQSILSDYDELIRDIEELEKEYNEFKEVEFNYLYGKNNYKSNYTQKHVSIPNTSIVRSYKNIYIKPDRSINKNYDSIWKLDLEFWEKDIEQTLKDYNEYKEQYNNAKREFEENKEALISIIKESEYKERYNNAYKNKQLKVHYIDVGQGDSILIQLPNDQISLIDGGSITSSKKVIDYLTSQGVKKIDYLVATHPHEDHIGGLTEIIKTFDIDKIYMPKATHTTKAFENLLLSIKDKDKKITLAKAGDILLDEEFLKLNVLAPQEDSNHRNLNEHSIVLKVTYKGNSFLFAGDAEVTSEEEMLNVKADLRADVLKIGHHGSDTSTTEKFLKSVNPKYAVISSGKDNQYGHPHQTTINKLMNNKAEIHRTDTEGTIVITSDGEKITVEKKDNKEKQNASPKQENNLDTLNKNTKPQTIAKPKPNTTTSNKKEITVYVTNTGSKYHRSGCRYLKKSKISINLSEAKNQGYGPCKVCRP